jgi:hypothetical protein
MSSTVRLSVLVFMICSYLLAQRPVGSRSQVRAVTPLMSDTFSPTDLRRREENPSTQRAGNPQPGVIRDRSGALRDVGQHGVKSVLAESHGAQVLIQSFRR